jgi:sugar phosphate isomerase/epimerase
MKQTYSLAQLTVLLKCSPPELIYTAALVGYDCVSLRLIPITAEEPRFPLAEDKEMLRQTRSALAATGIKVHGIDLARIVDGVSPRTYLPAMEIGAELGACHLLTSVWSTDRSYAIDALAELCDLAEPLGLTVDLEFVPIAVVSTLQGAVDVLNGVNRKNAGIVVDTMHATLSGMHVEDLDTVPHQWFHVAHLCDVPRDVPPTREGLTSVIREGRLYAGEGCADIAGILNRIPLVPYMIELPNVARVKELGYAEHARRCLQSAKDCLAARPRRGT